MRRMINHMGMRERMNSNDNIKREVGNIQSPRKKKKNAIKPILIEREPISQLVDPVPISVRMAIQRDREKARHK